MPTFNRYFFGNFSFLLLSMISSSVKTILYKIYKKFSQFSSIKERILINHHKHSVFKNLFEASIELITQHTGKLDQKIIRLTNWCLFIFFHEKAGASAIYMNANAFADPERALTLRPISTNHH